MTKISENAIKLLKEKQYFKENENTWEDLSKRVSIAISDAETDNQTKKQVQKDIYNAMINLDFIFSTPCLLNADKNNPGQLSSCFVLNTKDSIEEICRTDAEFSVIFQRNGGAGTDLSVLRPAKDTVETSKGYAGGVITFMEKYDFTADRMTRFNPSRKGAIKINLKDFHPQIEDFIHCKDDPEILNRMNISISLSDDFMMAVANNLNWNLEFPDHSFNKEIYNQEWDGNISKWKAKGYPVKVYKTVKASELFKEFAKSSWTTGEPATNYQSRMDRDNMNPHLSSEIYTNPCSEFTNIPYSSCNLGSINLLNCVKNNKFDFDKLKDLTSKAVRWLDNMISINVLPLKKIDEVTKSIRPIGLGIMGLADALYALGVKYNSAEGYKLAEKIIETMKVTAINTSVELAKERGEYPAWKGSRWEEANINIHNSSLLSIAPTGSISFIAGVSGGCEPNFALTFSRRTYDGNIYYVTNSIFEDKLKSLGIYSLEIMEKIEKNHGSCQGIKEIPEEIQNIFVTAHDLTPEEHVDMVEVLQRYVDLSLSKTVNFSNNATVEDIYNIYIYAWKKGLKGLSVYRDGCRANQVLSVERAEKEEIESILDRGYVIKAPSEADGKTYKFVSGCGNAYINVTWDEQGNINQTFTNKGSSGTCKSNQEAVSRLVSLSLRGGIPIEKIIDQLESVDICPSYTTARAKGKPVSKGASCPHAIANILKQALKDVDSKFKNIIVKANNKIEGKVESIVTNSNNCPDCKEPLVNEGGCVGCKSCGYSKCG